MKRDEHLDRRSVAAREAWDGMRGQGLFDSGLLHSLSNHRRSHRLIFWNATVFRFAPRSFLGEQNARASAGPFTLAAIRNNRRKCGVGRREEKSFKKCWRSDCAYE